MKHLKPAEETLLRHLLEIPLFSFLTPDELRPLAQSASMISWDKNEFVFRQGEKADRLSILVQGSASIFIILPDGSQKIIHLINPISMLAEAACFLNRNFPAHCQTSSESVTICINRADLIEFTTKYPEMPWKFIGGLFSRLKEFTAMMETHGQKNAVTRLASFIIGRADSAGNVILPAKKNQIANFLGLRPESFSRALNILISSGAVQSDGAELKVVNSQTLESFLNDLS